MYSKLAAVMSARDTGSQNTHIATLVERQSRFTMLVKAPGKDTVSEVTALTAHVRQLPSALRRSLIWDRGMELAQHKQLTIDTKMQVYFCDPQSPWQRGTNENTIRLLRQYFPKGIKLSQYSQADMNKIVVRLNQRPRKTLGCQTPATILEDGDCNYTSPLEDEISGEAQANHGFKRKTALFCPIRVPLRATKVATWT